MTLGANQVLSWNGSSVFAVADPSVPIADYTVTFGASDMSVPQRPLCVMNLNQIYPVDVYFYLEGCDPDCSDAITHNEPICIWHFTAFQAGKEASDEGKQLGRLQKESSNQAKAQARLERSRVRTSILLLLLALVAVTATTVAWFSIADRARVRT